MKNNIAYCIYYSFATKKHGRIIMLQDAYEETDGKTQKSEAAHGASVTRCWVTLRPEATNLFCHCEYPPSGGDAAIPLIEIASLLRKTQDKLERSRDDTAHSSA